MISQEWYFHASNYINIINSDVTNYVSLYVYPHQYIVHGLCNHNAFQYKQIMASFENGGGS